VERCGGLAGGGIRCNLAKVNQYAKKRENAGAVEKSFQECSGGEKEEFV